MNFIITRKVNGKMNLIREYYAFNYIIRLPMMKEKDIIKQRCFIKITI